MKITVVIPTHRRNALLRSALESVRNQSRRNLIAEVIVSENSDDNGSLTVAAEFSDLPLRHVFQAPPTDAGTHFARLLDRATTDWVALLGDDDMWGRYHLEEAARALEMLPTAVAYAAQYVNTRNEARLAAWGPCYLLAENMQQRNSTFESFWLLDHVQMTVESLLLTPLNMWAVVARRDALVKAFAAFSEPGSGYDSDRYMFWLLGMQGPLVVGREIGLFYRQHETNACARMIAENRDYHMKMAYEYTRRMIRETEAAGIDLKSSWLAALSATPANRRREYLSWAIPGAKRAVIDEWKTVAENVFRDADRPYKRIVSDLTPPALWRLASRVRHAWFPPTPSGRSS
jgi:glycosyltransferase involved in cell wall biosynthesis